MAYPRANTNGFADTDSLDAWIEVIQHNEKTKVLLSTAMAVAYLRFIKHLQQDSSVVALLFKKESDTHNAFKLYPASIGDKSEPIIAFSCEGSLLAEWIVAHRGQRASTRDIRLTAVSLLETPHFPSRWMTAELAKKILGNANEFTNFLRSSEARDCLPVTAVVTDFLVRSIYGDVKTTAIASTSVSPAPVHSAAPNGFGAPLQVANSAKKAAQAVAPKPASSSSAPPSSASDPTGSTSTAMQPFAVAANAVSNAAASVTSVTTTSEDDEEEEDEEEEEEEEDADDTKTPAQNSKPKQAAVQMWKTPLGFMSNKTSTRPYVAPAVPRRTAPVPVNVQSQSAGGMSMDDHDTQMPPKALRDKFTTLMYRACALDYIAVNAPSTEDTLENSGAASDASSSTNGPRPSSKHAVAANTRASYEPEGLDNDEFDAFAGYDYDAANEAVVPVY